MHTMCGLLCKYNHSKFMLVGVINWGVNCASVFKTVKVAATI